MRGASIERAIEVIRLIARQPCTTGELATALVLSRDTIERILAALRRSGLPLTSEQEGREVWHSLPRGCLT